MKSHTATIVLKINYAPSEASPRSVEKMLDSVVSAVVGDGWFDLSGVGGPSVDDEEISVSIDVSSDTARARRKRLAAHMREYVKSFLAVPGEDGVGLRDELSDVTNEVLAESGI